MQPLRRIKTQHGVWLLAAALITALSLLVAFVPSAHAQQEPQVVANLQQSQIYNDDLEVESGQVIEGDVNVYSGDVNIRRDGRIQGNLNVYSGDVEVAGGRSRRRQCYGVERRPAGRRPGRRLGCGHGRRHRSWQ